MSLVVEGSIDLLRKIAMPTMDTEEIKAAIESLPDEQFDSLRKWFLEKDWKKWDEQIEEDSRSGRLGFLVKEALYTEPCGLVEEERLACP